MTHQTRRLGADLAPFNTFRCLNGCPNCIVPPRSTEEIDKNFGIAVTRQVLNDTAQPNDENSTTVSGLGWVKVLPIVV